MLTEFTGNKDNITTLSIETLQNYHRQFRESAYSAGRKNYKEDKITISGNLEDLATFGAELAEAHHQKARGKKGFPSTPRLTRPERLLEDARKGTSWATYAFGGTMFLLKSVPDSKPGDNGILVMWTEGINPRSKGLLIKSLSNTVEAVVNDTLKRKAP